MCSRCERFQWEQTRFSSSLETRPLTLDDIFRIFAGVVFPAIGCILEHLPYSRLGCQLHGFAHFTLGNAQIFTITAISFTRYLVVCHSRRWEVGHSPLWGFISIIAISFTRYLVVCHSRRREVGFLPLWGFIRIITVSFTWYLVICHYRKWEVGHIPLWGFVSITAIHLLDTWLSVTLEDGR